MRQSFAWWSFTLGREVEPAALLRDAAAAGAQGVEMLPEALWPVARDAGLSLVTLTGHALERGFNDPALHASLADEVRRNIADLRQRLKLTDCPFDILFALSRTATAA